MKIIGVTGNIGSGKTIISEKFKEENSCVINADKVGHKILEYKKYAYEEVIKEFGVSILIDGKKVDRKKLGEIVFNNKNKLDKLTLITHKYIVKYILETINIEKEKGYEFLVIDAPLLIDVGMEKLCDYVIVVTSNDDDRIKRIMERDLVSKELAIKKMKSQKTKDELIKYGDYIIENIGTIYELEKKTIKLINELRGK